jgi:dTDP-4-amino-4,6-dideoxygalactose transaminase
MKVDFYSLTGIPFDVKARYSSLFSRVLEGDSLIDGAACQLFESEFSKYLKVNFTIGVGNGFDALRIGLLALGIQPGDKVAVPSHTFIATWFAVESIGATPIGIDVDLLGQIDLDILEEQTDIKCVIPVHMHGTHCDMKRLSKWSAENNIKVLEDCAQAAGLDIQGKKAGSWGDAAAFSFYPTKNLFALGDGGAICTQNSKVATNARSISRYGAEAGNKYSHVRLGQNSRLDSIQAAFLSENLNHLDRWNECRREIANIYDSRLAHLRPYLDNTRKSNVYHHYVIYVENRDKLKKNLAEVGISTEIHYPILAANESTHLSTRSFPKGNLLSNHGLSIPMSPWQTLEETSFVIENIDKLAKSVRTISLRDVKHD